MNEGNVVLTFTDELLTTRRKAFCHVFSILQTSEIRNQYSTTTSTLQLDVIHEKIPFIQEFSLISSDGHHTGTWHM